MKSEKLKIIIKNLQKKLPINPKRIKKTILKILSKEDVNPVRNIKSLERKKKIPNGVKRSGEITICFVNDREIQRLNLKYSRKNIPTDVLAFDVTNPEDSRANIFADIVISTDAAIRNALEFKTKPLSELYLYLVHGMLHLLGYDDRSRKQRELIRRKEKEYVNT